MQRHEIPTHLNVADKAFAGLTMRQLLCAAVGLALAYGAASNLPVPFPGQLAAAAIVLTGTLLLVFWRPEGRPAEEWIFVLLRYWATGRTAIWRPKERATQSNLNREVILRPKAAMSTSNNQGGDVDASTT